jgi:hypothetical protein
VTTPGKSAAKAPFPTRSAFRGIDSLDHTEVVADRPVLGQAVAIDGEDVELCIPN